MVEDIRDVFYHELSQKLESAGIRAIVKTADPVGGKVIKVRGIALFKKLNTANPFRHRGIAIYRRLSDSIIDTLGGKRAKGKNDWVAAPLTPANYPDMMEALFKVAETLNDSRNLSMSRRPYGRRAKKSRFKPIATSTSIYEKKPEIIFTSKEDKEDYYGPPKTIPKKKKLPKSIKTFYVDSETREEIPFP